MPMALSFVIGNHQSTLKQWTPRVINSLYIVAQISSTAFIYSDSCTEVAVGFYGAARDLLGFLTRPISHAEHPRDSLAAAATAVTLKGGALIISSPTNF